MVAISIVMAAKEFSLSAMFSVAYEFFKMAILAQYFACHFFCLDLDVQKRSVTFLSNILLLLINMLLSLFSAPTTF